jgi:uridine kinase
VSDAGPGATPATASGAYASARLIVAAVRGWQARSPGGIVVAIDGHGAAGKTTLADAAARELGAEVLHTDDHFHPARAGSDSRPMAQYYDWERLRTAILPALARAASPLLIEGVSSACPALADLVTHAVYVDTPEPERIERLRTRITDEEWDQEWLAAERAYFARRPPSSFDLVVPGA